MASPVLKAVEKSTKARRKGRDHMNAKLDIELKRRMKIHCAAEGITMQEFLTEAIQAALMKAQKKAGKDDAPLP